MQVALLYGGRSPEHEVSINSAYTVHKALQEAGHSVLLIAITLEGRWFLQRELRQKIDTTQPLLLQPGLGIYWGKEKLEIAAAFATTHGYQGEDGNLQGTCLLCNIPLCGCDTASSAIGMHKAIASALFSANGIPTVPSCTLDSYQLKTLGKDLFNSVIASLGKDLFIKPENSGSSVGVQALPQATYPMFLEAVETAAQYSERVLVQKYMEATTEVECALLRTEDGTLHVAGPGRVIDPAKEAAGFLSYAHKYGQVDTAHIQVPAGLNADIEEKIRTYARTAFLAIKADGYARVDFFLQGESIFLNEINTSPGMTTLSHYPVLMASIGYDLPHVLDALISHALHRASAEKGRHYTPPRT
ncbi:MAG: D-alanine--D-alanine ligase family protein [Sphaerochaetaceae bacterium]